MNDTRYDDTRYIDEEIDLRNYLSVMLRRKWLIGIVAGFAILIAIAVTLMDNPVYRSQSVIQIERQSSGRGNLEYLLTDSLYGGGPSQTGIQTQVEILKSRTIAEKAVKAMNYQLQAVSERKMIGILIDRLKGKLKNVFYSKKSLLKEKQIKPISIKPISIGTIPEERSYILRFDSPDRYKIRWAEDKTLIGMGELNKPFSGPDFSILVEGDPARRGRVVKFRLTTRDAAIDALQESLSVSPVGNTELITVSATASSPTLAAVKVNATVSEYRNLTISGRTENATMALDFIDRQIKTLDKKLEISEDRLKSLKEKEKVVSLSDNARATLEQLTKFDMELKKSESLRMQAELIYENMAKNVDVSGTDIFALGTGLESPRLLALAGKLSDLQSRRITLRIDYKEKHPSIIETDMQIAETKKKIRAELSSIIASLRVQRESIRSDMAGYESRIGTLPDAEKRLAELTRDAVAQQDIYSFLLQKKQELEVARASEIGNVRIVDPAIPGDRIKPKVKQSILLALIVGLFMGVGIAFFLEYLDNTIKSPDDLKQITDLPLLGSIAKFDAQADGNGKELVTHTMPQAGVSEAFRTIRTNVFFASYDTPKRLIGVTSALPGEGKTLFVANLAVSIAQADKKVLIIDADMRRPRLHRIFSQKRAPGLSNLIMAENIEGVIGDVTRKLPISGMDVICSGDIPHNPNELLGSQKMKSIIDLVSERYDYILFDCPPVLSVSDAFVLSDRLDGIIFVISAEKTEKNALKQALEAIPDEKVLGMVLNNIDIERDGYYYRYYQYCYSYGDQDESAGKKRKKSRKGETRIKKALGYLQDKNPWKQR